jgi:hypothetical protein
LSSRRALEEVRGLLLDVEVVVVGVEGVGGGGGERRVGWGAG